MITPRLQELEDEATLEALRSKLESLFEEPLPHRVVVNLEFVNHLSRQAIALLLAHHLRLDWNGGALRICQAHARIIALLDQVRLTMLVDCYPTLDEAVLAAWVCKQTSTTAQRRELLVVETPTMLPCRLIPPARSSCDRKHNKRQPTARSALKLLPKQFNVYVTQYSLSPSPLSSWASGCKGSLALKKRSPSPSGACCLPRARRLRRARLRRSLAASPKTQWRAPRHAASRPIG